jgi:glycosidase
MQWDASPNAGFTTATKPWMRVNDDYKQVNAASQVDDPKSIYHLWRQVLQQRKARKDIFVYGDFDLVDEANEKVFAYKRTTPNGDAALVVSNFSADTVKWPFEGKAKEVVVSPTEKTVEQVNGGGIELGPYEAIGLLL